MKHFVYILSCSDTTLYTGYTTDIQKRLAVHNGEAVTPSRNAAAARYTRGRRPVTLVYTETFKTRSEALKREAAIKKLSRLEKELLIKGQATS